MLSCQRMHDRGCPRRRGRCLASISSRIARAVDLALAYQAAGRAYARALVVLEHEPEALLDLRAPLEQARRDLGRLRLRMADSAIATARAGGVAGPLGLSSAARPSASAPQTSTASKCGPGSGSAGSVPSVRRRLPPRPAPRRRARSAVGLSASYGAGELEQDVGALDARTEPPRGAARGSRPPARRRRRGGGSRRPQPPLPGRGGIVRGQLGGELGELGRGGVAPRAAAARRCIQLGGDGRVGPVGGERQVAGPLLDVRDRLGERPVDGAALPDRRLLVADRGEQRMGEADRESSSSTTPSCSGRLERLEDALPVAVGRRDQLDRRPRQRRDLKSRRRPSPSGSRARRPPSSSRRLSGTRNAWPGTGRVSVRTSSRPSSSAKNGLPADRLLHAGELGPRQLEPETLLEQMVQRSKAQWAERSRSAAPPGTSARARGAADSGAVRRVASRPTARRAAVAAQSGVRRPTRNPATGVVDRD